MDRWIWRKRHRRVNRFKEERFDCYKVRNTGGGGGGGEMMLKPPYTQLQDGA